MTEEGVVSASLYRIFIEIVTMKFEKLVKYDVIFQNILAQVIFHCIYPKNYDVII